MSGGAAGGGGPGGGYVAPGYAPQGPMGSGAQQPQGDSIMRQTVQEIETTLNAILTQLKTGISLLASVPTYTFAGLPAAATNRATVLFVSDARKPGEGPGAGTGMLSFSDGSNWISTAGTVLTH